MYHQILIVLRKGFVCVFRVCLNRRENCGRACVVLVIIVARRSDVLVICYQSGLKGFSNQFEVSITKGNFDCVRIQFDLVHGQSSVVTNT